MESKKKWFQWAYFQNRNRLWNFETMVAQEERWEEGMVRKFGMSVYTLLHLKWITNKDLLYSTWNSAQCYVAVWIGGEFGGEWIHVYVWLSPFAIYLKPSQHCLLIIYTSIQNKMLFFFLRLFVFTAKEAMNKMKRQPSGW